MKIFALMSLVSPASAYLISSPGGSNGWSTAGPNVVTWQQISTDPQNFTIVLSNDAKAPSYQKVLAALVDGFLGKFPVSSPSTAFASLWGPPKGRNDGESVIYKKEHLLECT